MNRTNRIHTLAKPASTAKAVFAASILAAMLLSLMPAAVFGAAGIDVYSSTVAVPENAVPAQAQPVNRYGDGAEITVIVVDNNDGFPASFYAASNRPSYDSFYYSVGSGEWTPISLSSNSYAAIQISSMTTAIAGTTRARELRLKVVSTAGGTSRIAFGIDASCAVDCALGRSLTHDSSHIIDETWYAVSFTSTGSSSGNRINAAYSYAAYPDRSVATQSLPLSRYGSGAEFTVTAVANSTITASDRLYVATSRPSTDYLYYRLGSGDWLPYYAGSDISLSSAVALTPFAHSTSVSSTVHEIRLKIVSTAAGTSQVVFGTDVIDVSDYAAGRSMSQYNGLANIVGQRSYPATFTSGSSGSNSSGSGSNNINVAYTVVTGPDRSVSAQVLPLDRYDGGAEFSVMLMGYSSITANDKLYIASSRPNVDYLYYRLGSGDWLPYYSGSDIPMASALALTPFSHSVLVSSAVHELRLKIVSAAPGTSHIVFGADAECVTDYALGRTPSHGLSHIAGQRRYPAEFGTAYNNKNSGNHIIAYSSSAVGPDRAVAAQALPLNRYNSGAEFTLTVTGNSAITATDRIYIATSRPDTDYLFYRLGSGDWLPYYSGGDIPIAAATPLTPFTHSINISSNVHELRLKVVSTSGGTSQIVFGTDPIDVGDYAAGRAMAQNNGFANIIGQRSYPADFTGASYGVNQLTLYVSGYYNYGYGSPVTASANEKNMASSADQKQANNSDYYILNALVTSANGVVASGREVSFSVTSGSGAALSSARATTNASGMAEILVYASTPGSVDVLATVSGIAEQTGVTARRDKVTMIFRSAGTATGSGSTTVTGFQAETVSAGVKLRWDPPSSSGETKFRVYRSDNANYEGSSLTATGITGNDFIDVNVKAYTTYFYSVRQVIREADSYTGRQEELGPATSRLAVTAPSAILGESLSPSGTTGGRKFILMTVFNSYMTVNGVKKEIDPGRGTVPQLVNNRTLVPIRAIVEEMGGTAGWQDSTREISLQCKQFNVRMWLDRFDISVNNVSKAMDVAPASINGRTMVPLRFAAENLGCEVEWLSGSQQIVIVYY